MRIFNDVRDLYSETERDLKEMGIEYMSQTVQDQEVNKRTKELIGHAYQMNINESTVKYLENLAVEKGIPRAWLITEMKERLYECVNPGKAWQNREDIWSQFIRNGRFAYTYSERLYPQYMKVLTELETKPNTRQAVLTMFWPQDQDQLGGQDRVPCSMTYQFLRRENGLYLIYTMRSCDFYKFFLADVFFACKLLEHFATILEITPRSFQHQIGSLHAFEEDLEGVF